MVTSSSCNRGPTTLAKRTHRFTHAPASELVDLLVRTGCDRRTADSVSFEVLKSCIICAKSEAPLASLKISFKHICEEFNEVEADFTYDTIRSTKYCGLHVVGAGTSFSEASIARKKTTYEITAIIESI